jgi:hypothetical protein
MIELMHRKERTSDMQAHAARKFGRKIARERWSDGGEHADRWEPSVYDLQNDAPSHYSEAEREEWAYVAASAASWEWSELVRMEEEAEAEVD